jgi:hypothetical protein
MIQFYLYKVLDMSADDYQTVYGVGLLDDLHNYFPRILYRPQEFVTVPDLLAYVQQTTMRRFNLFENGNRMYQNTRPSYSSVARQPVNSIHVNTSHRANSAIDLSTLLRTLLVQPAGPLANSFNDPVIVHASQDIIENASSQETLEEDSENNCAICQDSMRQGELVRKLTVCSHQFHKSCIDNWLLNQSVYCPTCRHDIRQESISAATTSAATTSAATATTSGAAGTGVPSSGAAGISATVTAMTQEQYEDLITRQLFRSLNIL